ncbi:MAG TPA: helix-turn-helix domain-containing protein [Microbacterium sp.]|uniref:helix-turn-helix transcriptional regulator n=1 Tax=Microbacterium sp. TaxID=51671 RepID=UPI002F92E5D0
MIWLTPAQVSEQTGFAQQTLANWRSQTTTGDVQVGPEFVKVGRLVRYDADAVKAWQQSQMTAAAS